MNLPCRIGGRRRACQRRGHATLLPLLLLVLVAAATMLAQWPVASAEVPPQTVRQVLSPRAQAAVLVQRTIERLTLGPAFDAKLRQRIWAAGREVVGIGHYEQSGGGTGRFSLEMTIHDGDSRQSIRQISDGKLAWIRTQLGDSVTLRRVDLGRIDEVYRESTRPGAVRLPQSNGYDSILTAEETAPPWMRVGGLVELVDQLAKDFDLRVGKGTVEEQPVWILRGVMNDRARQRIHETTDHEGPTPLCPYEVQLAIAAVGDASGFGVGLPVQLEFYSEPVTVPPGTPPGERESTAQPPQQTPPQAVRSGPSDRPRGRLISLLEIYAVRPIQPSPEERFRFKRDDPDVIFSNDTRRYLERLTQ